MTLDAPAPAAAPGPATAAGAVVYAKDLARMARFYERVIGLERVEIDAQFVLLRGCGIDLVVHQIPPRWAEQIVIDSPPQRRQDTPIKLTFVVPDLAAAREAALSLGGVLDDPSLAWDWRGRRHCDGHDPEGNVFRLQQALMG